MQDAYTANEIAQAIPTGMTDRAIRKRADLEGWPFSAVPQGKGRPVKAYKFATLPADVREALARVAASEAASAGRMQALAMRLNEDLNARAASASRQGGLARIVCLSGRARSRAEARAALVAACRELTASTGLGRRAGRELFAVQYNAQAIAVDAEIRELVPTVCANSLHNWEKALEREGLARLAGNYGQHRRGSGVIDSTPELRQFILAMLVDHPHADAKNISRAIDARFRDQNLRVPLRNLQRWLRSWKEQNAQLHAAMTNPDGWRSKYKAAGGSASAHILRLNQRWEIDSTQGDVMLADGRRHAIIGCIDVYTRRIKLHVARTSSSAGVLSLLRRCLLDWGLPEELGTDNGQDYVSRQVQTVLAGLDIRQDVAPPFTPEHKPFVERAFRTFSHGLLELASGYIGHNVAERKEIESRRSMADRLFKTGQGIELRMTPEELQDLCDRWTDTVYARDPHASLNGRSPWQMAAEWAEPVARIKDERALDVLLLPAADGDGMRRIAKKGIKLGGAWYDSPALGGYEGQNVKVLVDDGDLGSCHVFLPAGNGWEWLCQAVCPEIVGISRRDMAMARQRRQKKIISEQKRELKQASRAADTKLIAREVLEYRAAQAGKLTHLPQPSTPHETEALRQAGLAARAQDGPAPAPADQAREMRELAARELAKPAAVVHQMPETPQQRYRRWQRLDDAQRAGAVLGEADSRWWRNYQLGSEFRSMRDLDQFYGAQSV